MSLYAPAAQRLGLDFSGGGTSGGQGNGMTSNGSFHRSLNGGNDNGQSAAGNAYQSSWNAGSSFGLQSEESSWSTRRLTVDRLGHKQSDSLAASRDAKGESAIAGGSNGYTVGDAGGYSPAGNVVSSSRYSISGSKGQSANSLTSRFGSSRTNSPAYGSIDGRAGDTYSVNKPGQPLNDDMAGTGTGNLHDGSATTGGAANGGSADRTEAARKSLTYFPQAAYSQSALGESPFSSSSGIGELHFLNPNIYAATSQGHSLSIGEKGSATEDSLRQAFVQRDHPAGSASHYGLITHPGADRSTQGKDDMSTLKKSSHLRTGILNSENP